MAYAIARWLVRHHPGWWRARYEGEVLALVEASSPGLRSVWDLARSCARVWTECRALGATEPPRNALLGVLRVFVRCVQGTLAVATIVAVVGVLYGVCMSLWLWLAPRGLFWVTGPPVATATIVALVAHAGTRPRWTRTQMLLRVVGAAMAAGSTGMLALYLGGDPHWAVSDPRWAAAAATLPGGIPLLVLRGLSVWLAFAAAEGLAVHWVFQGLRLGRCVVNCRHVVPATGGEVSR